MRTLDDFIAMYKGLKEFDKEHLQMYNHLLTLKEYIERDTPRVMQDYLICPKCEQKMDKKFYLFCNECGQRVDWPVFPEYPHEAYFWGKGKK